MSSALNNLSLAFDLDGTLVDTAPDLIRVLNEVTKPDGLAPVAVADGAEPYWLWIDGFDQESICGRKTEI